MKHRVFVYLFLSITTFQNAYSSILLSASLAPEHVTPVTDLMNTISSYPLTVVTSDNVLQQAVQNRAIKATIPRQLTKANANGKHVLNSMNFTILKPKPDAFQSYPAGATIFPGYPDVSAKFDTMLALFKSTPDFIPFFRKVHINALNELYHYLISIYVNFNLQHVGIVQNASGAMQVSIPAFLQDETEYDANKKTLIINHMLNIIESQFNGAIRSYIPKIPQTFASYAGKTLIQNDYSIDLSQFIMQQIEPEAIANKQKYLAALAAYLDFFQTYTSYLNKPHPKQPQHFTAFVDIAEQINQFLYGDNPSATNKDSIAVEKMNPPLFYFSLDDIRALKIIPYLAKEISPTSKAVLWPDHIVQAANQEILVNNHPIAYFKTSDNKIVSSGQGGKLYLCLKNGANIFEEELIPQPAWLNSWDGVCKILQACFGDFSALLGLQILDPCMEAIVENTVMAQQGKDPNANNSSAQTCKAYLTPVPPSQAITQPTITPDLLPALSSPGAPTLSDISMTPTLSNIMPSATANSSPTLVQQQPIRVTA